MKTVEQIRVVKLTVVMGMFQRIYIWERLKEGWEYRYYETQLVKATITKLLRVKNKIYQKVGNKPLVTWVHNVI